MHSHGLTMSEELQRKPWHKLPSAIDPEVERRADEIIEPIRAAMRSGKVYDSSEQRGAPVEVTRESVRKSLQEAREKGIEPIEYDPIMDYCSY